MTTTRVVRVAAFGCLAVMLVVLGAALRPLIFTEQAAPAEILSDNEIGFVHDMVAHHQQALFIAQRLNTNVDPAVSRLAQQIDDSQRTARTIPRLSRAGGYRPGSGFLMSATRSTSGKSPTTTRRRRRGTILR